MEEKTAFRIQATPTGLQIEPAIASANSIELIYYKDNKEDSLRYSRYYSFTSSSDTIGINLIKRQLDATFTIYEQALKCRSEGKIHLLANGETLKVIYFSKECKHAYFIKNGLFYYFSLNHDMASFLDNKKRKAIEPSKNE